VNIKREIYLKRIRPFMGTDLIKVLTGIRRCGKSVLLRLIQEELLASGVSAECFVRLDFDEPVNYPLREGKAFYEHIMARLKQIRATRGAAEKIYLFFDEIQEVNEWETYTNGLRMQPDVDVYVTGSNSKLLSGELATYLAGRYIQFEIQPFSFAEFSEMHRLLRGEKQVTEVFNDYVVFGGMPFLLNLGLQYEPSMEYLSDIYQSVLIKDVLQRNNMRDVELLQRIIVYVLANVGKTFSARSIFKYLKNENQSVSTDTVLNYLDACETAFLFHRIRRNDLQGKRLLSINEKYYVTDHGLREAVCKDNTREIGLVFENMVCMELVRRGYTVTVGKVGDLEIDFVAEKRGELVYVQVCFYLADDTIVAREFGALEKLVSDYPKFIISADDFDRSYKGIKHLNIRDFLLGKELV
jgi:predicted AAA+ superfamily ATPase